MLTKHTGSRHSPGAPWRLAESDLAFPDSNQASRPLATTRQRSKRHYHQFTAGFRSHPNINGLSCMFTLPDLIMMEFLCLPLDAIWHSKTAILSPHHVMPPALAAPAYGLSYPDPSHPLPPLYFSSILMSSS